MVTGGGIHFDSSNTGIELKDLKIVNNKAYRSGGGVAFSGSNVAKIVNSSIENNWSPDGGIFVE
jgi:hypothetical protein